MATHHNNNNNENKTIPFVVSRKEVVLVKPSKQTPSQVLTFSSIDNDLALELICQTLYVYQGNNPHHQPSNDPASLIKDAISKVLVYYYPLAGKLRRDVKDGRLYLTCNGDGVPFLEASVNSQFFTAMAELASGKIEPTVKPVWERDRLVVSKTDQIQHPDDVQLPFKFNFDELAKSPYLPTSEIVHQCFNVNSEAIKHLKQKLVKVSESKNLKLSFTTIEALGAYIWRSRFRALKLNPDGKTSFFLATGIRKHMKPPLPDGYYGNAFVSSTTVLIGKDLNEMKLCETAKLIKESKKIACTEKYIWSELEKREKLMEMNIKIEGNGAAMVLTDWRQLGLLEEVDFGWKGAVNIIPVPWEMFGYVDLCFFMPPCNLDTSMKGGVRVLVSLPKAAMSKFKEEMDALSYLGSDDEILI
ncbi:inactive tetrahydroanabasine acetyltransferase pauper allele-like [Euphorbia lathyris]|uniref:inactive tetrahydroanabasine acetyltransferase pauper allele-like n=1 Tax=Euphorbia lathyris TaxID=212925 RepID=UPI0033144BFE